jgi:hypothetical protein
VFFGIHGMAFGTANHRFGKPFGDVLSGNPALLRLLSERLSGSDPGMATAPPVADNSRSDHSMAVDAGFAVGTEFSGKEGWRNWQQNAEQEKKQHVYRQSSRWHLILLLLAPQVVASFFQKIALLMDTLGKTELQCSR